MVRTNQGGSILNFIIVGVVLAALLIGGAYFVRQKTRLPADTASAPAPSEQKPSSKKEQSPSKQQPAPSDTSKDKTAKNGSKQPAPAQPSTPAPAPSQPSSNELPQTGPAQTFSSVMALGLLGYALAAYLRSRRARAVTL